MVECGQTDDFLIGFSTVNVRRAYFEGRSFTTAVGASVQPSTLLSSLWRAFLLALIRKRLYFVRPPRLKNHGRNLVKLPWFYHDLREEFLVARRKAAQP